MGLELFRIIAELLAYASAVGSTVSFASDLTVGKNDVEEINTSGTTLLPQPISHQAASGIMVMKTMLVKFHTKLLPIS